MRISDWSSDVCSSDLDDRRQHRKGDMAEALPGAGAVDRRRLVERLRNGLQPGEQRDRDERDAAPGVGGDDTGARVVGVAKEVYVAVDQAKPHQSPGNDRKLIAVVPP